VDRPRCTRRRRCLLPPTGQSGLGCGLLEQQVLSLLHAGLGHLGQLLADAPARGDNLVDVLVHDLRVLVQAAGGGVRGLVDVDVRLRGDRGDILDVEVRLVVRAAGPGLNLAAVNRMIDSRLPARTPFAPAICAAWAAPK